MGWGHNANIIYTSIQGSKRIYIDILNKEIEQQSLINQYSAKHCV